MSRATFIDSFTMYSLNWIWVFFKIYTSSYIMVEYVAFASVVIGL